MVTQTDVAKACRLDVSSVNRILHGRQGSRFKKATVRRVLRVARTMGYDFARVKHSHRRRHPRVTVNIPAEFSILTRDGAVFEKAPGTIRDLSVSGAHVCEVQVKSNRLPAEPFDCRVKPTAGDARGIAFTGRVVRLSFQDGIHYGVEFTDLDRPASKKLKDLLHD